MQQVLFRIPDPTGNFPDGIPVYGYGMMLFLTFLACTWFARRHAARAGMTPEQISDLGIWLFIFGIIGGRVVFALQYRLPVSKFFNLWEGGLVVYGALIGGFISYWVFYWLFLKKFNVSSWRLGDIAAPAICIGIALGRVGCLLNGCCYGAVAPNDCPRLGFPLLTAPVREAVVKEHNYQTIVGFSVEKRDDADTRTVVGRLEPESAAERSGLQSGDRIIAFNGHHNDLMLWLDGNPDAVDKVAQGARGEGYRVEVLDSSAADHGRIAVFVPDPTRFAIFRKWVHEQAPTGSFNFGDGFGEALYNWPRGVASLALTVERHGKELALPPFTPRSIGLHPTQLYETVSMVLLFFLLMAFYPFRRHNGQVFVVFVICYAVHRFLNEMLRDDTPIEGFHMTLSQNISVLMVGAAIVLEFWLRWTQPRRSASGGDNLAPAAPTERAAPPAPAAPELNA